MTRFAPLVAPLSLPERKLSVDQITLSSAGEFHLESPVWCLDPPQQEVRLWGEAEQNCGGMRAAGRRVPLTTRRQRGGVVLKAEEGGVHTLTSSGMEHDLTP